MDFNQTLDFLYGQLPMYQRDGVGAFKKSLDNIRFLCEHLNNPQDKFESIHVGGTNGKGSCSSMLAAVVQASGFKTGLYTSPHLKSFTERIRIDSEEVQPGYIIDFVNYHKAVIEELNPSFFELTVAMAFDYFASREVEVAIIEVGLGGRLDSTNIINPIACLITNIGLDHTDLLGDTYMEIAYEKAGIIKPGVPVVIGERNDETDFIFERKAEEVDAPIVFAEDVFQIENVVHEETRIVCDVVRDDAYAFRKLATDLKGEFQIKNLKSVLAVLECLPSSKYNFDQRDIRMGLSHVKQFTGLKGRWQTIGEKPLILCDVAHNADGVKEAMNALNLYKYKELHIIWGSVKGKDHTSIFNLLPQEAKYYFCEANIPRSVNAEELKELAGRTGRVGVAVKDVNKAIEMAKKAAGEQDLVFIGGSNFIIAEIKEL